jgi:hypothetical protein
MLNANAFGFDLFAPDSNVEISFSLYALEVSSPRRKLKVPEAFAQYNRMWVSWLAAEPPSIILMEPPAPHYMG